MMARQMARPTPLDALPSPRSNGSKIRSAWYFGTPVPSSDTDVSTRSPERRDATRTVERGGE